MYHLRKRLKWGFWSSSSELKFWKKLHLTQSAFLLSLPVPLSLASLSHFFLSPSRKVSWNTNFSLTNCVLYFQGKPGTKPPAAKPKGSLMDLFRPADMCTTTILLSIAWWGHYNYAWHRHGDCLVNQYFMKCCRIWIKRNLITSQTRVKCASRIHHWTIFKSILLSLFFFFCIRQG